jgi:hypothetical protein
MITSVGEEVAALKFKSAACVATIEQVTAPVVVSWSAAMEQPVVEVT